MVQMMEPMMRMAAAGMLSAQVGQGIGRLATEVLSGSDLGFPLSVHCEAPYGVSAPAFDTFAEMLDGVSNME